MSDRHPESAGIAGLCFLAGLLCLALGACRQAVDPPADPCVFACEGSSANVRLASGSGQVRWADGSESPGSGICPDCPSAAGLLLVTEGAGIDLTSSGSLAISCEAPTRLVFSSGPDHAYSCTYALRRVGEWIVAEDGAGRELARGTELGEQTDGTLILRDARGWEVWRSPEPCPPQWSRLPR